MRIIFDVPGDNRMTVEKLEDAQKLLSKLINSLQYHGIYETISLSMVGDSFSAKQFDHGIRIRYKKEIKT